MKKAGLFLLGVIALAVLVTFQNCGDKDNESAKDKTIRLLSDKTEWTVQSVSVPAGTATTSADWLAFKLSFTKSNMTCSGHPVGAQAVWPSGGYTVSDDGKTITRSDAVAMSVLELTETAFRVNFAVPDGTELGGRIAALDGEYTFNMK
ncbi:MAG: hypothetical protein U5K79_24470 [Cyclobacteriaceae bacterium]|nr:hypothetical protein [Cyclobacteriaceae bacterium]